MQKREFKLKNSYFNDLIHYLEKGELLKAPVLLPAPEKLKLLGETFCLVNTKQEAKLLSDKRKVFACTWQELKDICTGAVKEEYTLQQVLIVERVIDGKVIYYSKQKNNEFE